jgi:hypothetical protein
MPAVPVATGEFQTAARTRLRRSAVQILTQCTYRIPYKTKPLRKLRLVRTQLSSRLSPGSRNRKAGTNRV